MKISQLGEFGLIERIRAAVPAAGPDVIVGIGDDVAVLRASPESVWLATCDVQVEGAHFLRGAIAPRSLGRKALAINLSDIASAGGRPRFALVSLGLPGDLETEFIDELYAGLAEEGSAFGVDMVGGNISRSRLGMFIDVFLIGEAAQGDVVLRSGASVGDLVMVTGSVGDAAAGVALLLDPGLKVEARYADAACARRDAPTPRVREGALIGTLHQASAMIDVSDGIAGDLRHICEKSRVSARLYAEKIPVSADNRALARLAKGNEWHFALHGGEDYELLFTAAPGRAGQLATRITSETGTPVTVIGEITPAEAPFALVLPDGSSHSRWQRRGGTTSRRTGPRGDTMKTALSIAGSDSGGGAGIQADLKTFAAHGVFGTCAITALTAQNTVAVEGVYAIPPDFVARQIDAVVKDIGADAVKTGMLSNSRIIETVADRISAWRLRLLVVDPVMVAKSGDALLEPEARGTLISLLLPLAAVVTPNLPEAEVLCGFAITDMEGMRRAAKAILALGPRSVVVKGGHLESGLSTDLFYDGERFEELPAQRLATRNTHGTGCTFASAIAARLALGDGMLEAVRAAKAYVSAIIAASAELSIGHGHGPMNHMGLLLPRTR